MRVFVCVVVVGLAIAGLADGGPAHAAERTDLSDLAWLVGAWQGRQGGTEMEEHWIAPKGGLMLGLHRDLFSSGSTFFEYLRIESRDDGVFYVASPRGRAGTAFRLIANADRRVVFANPEHDYPQRILYWIDGDGALHARIEGTQNGENRASEWRWEPM